MRGLWTADPVIAEPTPADITLAAERWKISPDAAFGQIYRHREEAIRKARENPMTHGWEPSIWRVIDALFGMPWVDEHWAERMRLHLGFPHPVSVVLVNGGQRGSKSEYGAKRGSRLMQEYAQTRIWMLHTNMDMSKQYQQPLMWKYLPAHLRLKDIRTRTTYIKYSVKEGFTEGRFVLPNLSDCSFMAYEMDMKRIEGGNVHWINADEEVPADWVKTMLSRIAEKRGRMLITFTPVSGYTETVRLMQDGARVTKWSTGFMLPKDGGEPDVARALGLSAREYERLRAWTLEPKTHEPVSVWSRPEECGEWIWEVPREKVPSAEGGSTGEEWGVGTGRSQPPVPAGREFERVPRVMKVADPEESQAVVFVHSSDNPFGNPLGVWQRWARGSRDEHKMRFYGVATNKARVMFPAFCERHIIPDDQVPREGTNYQYVDPHGGRNFFMLYVRSTEDGRHYVFAEWPSAVYPIPGYGVLGPWALTDGRRMDGVPGPGQNNLGWSLLQYKAEIARLEGWKDYEERDETGPGVAKAMPGKNLMPESEGATGEMVRGWNQWAPARIKVTDRFLDARYANTQRQGAYENRTLFDELEDIGLSFSPTSGITVSRGEIEDGVELIQTALSWDKNQPWGFLNSAKLYVAESCVNTIFALRIWTGIDGQKGATKEIIDCLRWHFLKGNGYVGETRRSGGGGGGVY